MNWTALLIYLTSNLHTLFAGQIAVQMAKEKRRGIQRHLEI